MTHANDPARPLSFTLSASQEQERAGEAVERIRAVMKKYDDTTEWRDGIERDDFDAVLDELDRRGDAVEALTARDAGWALDVDEANARMEELEGALRVIKEHGELGVAKIVAFLSPVKSRGSE